MGYTMATFGRVLNARRCLSVQGKIRNIGIIAHIDAGKTTITERFLYLAGVTRSIGDVDRGNTVTDYLEIERERGITVQSAAVSFKWNNSVVNLIDTPGHVDFTLEVERCARVLDGVVTIVDSKAGVQAQTRKVWKQASKFNLPSVFFINKMDKPGSNVERVLDSLEEKLNVKGILTVYPLYKGEELYGFVDILSEKSLKFGDKQWTNIEKSFSDDFSGRKEELCFRLADSESSFSTLLLDVHNGDCTKISREDLYKALHALNSTNNGSVVSCGSALRCPQSVLPLLDQINSFLPSTDVAEKRVAEAFGTNLSALVFKISHEKRKRQLSYLRLYTGSLRSGAVVYNVNRDETDGPVRIFAPNGDELVSVNSVKAGEIAVVSGLKNTRTGDTVIADKSAISFVPKEDDLHLKREGDHLCFAGIDVPEPVYFCSVEPPSSAAIHDFEIALKEMCVEDPSIRVRQDKDSSQTIIEAMGELHLEIIKDKFLREYGLNVFIGPLQIAYREVVSKAIEHTATLSDEQGDSGKKHKASITFLLKPKKCGPFKKISVDVPSGSPPVRHEWQKAISEGCSNALHNGPILGFPVKDVHITLKNLTVSGGRINPAILSACAHKCVTEALCSPDVAELLEPIMKVEVALEGVFDGTQALLQELTKRRARIEQCELSTDQNSKVAARMPLSEMEGLATVVRILTSGLGSLSYTVEEYAPVSDHDKSAILTKLKIF